MTKSFVAFTRSRIFRHPRSISIDKRHSCDNVRNRCEDLPVVMEDGEDRFYEQGLSLSKASAGNFSTSVALMGRVGHSVLLDASPEAAYDYMTTLKHSCDWDAAVVAMEGQSDAPSIVGDTVTETVRAFGRLRKLQWTTVESASPRRFVMETKSLKLALMRGASLRITYVFEPAGKSLGSHTQLTRIFEYELRGIARLLDWIYLHRHFHRKGVVALTRLQKIIARQTPQGSLTHAH